MVVTITSAARPDRAVGDLRAGFTHWRLCHVLASRDIANMYRGARIGILWVVLSYLLFVGAIGAVFASSLSEGSVGDYLVYVGTGYLCWQYISSSITEGSRAFTGGVAFLKSVPLPLSILVYRVFLRNLYLSAIRFVPLLALMLIFGRLGTAQWGLAAVSIPVLALASLGSALLLGSLALRVRDILHFLQSVMGLMFFVTPVIWSAASAPDGSARHLLVTYNPFAAFLDVFRMPLVGSPPSAQSWMTVLVLTTLLLCAGLLAFAQTRGRAALYA